jgi:hypothetical protein
MVGRIEWVLVLTVAVALFLGLGNRQRIVEDRHRTLSADKEAELFGARAREINATGLVNAFEADHAEMIRKVWYLERFELVNPEIRALRARRAVRSEREIDLEGNVTLLRKDGARYEAAKVRYDLRRKTLRSFGPFRGEREENFVRGVDFLYEIPRKRTEARDVFAHYILADDNRSLR